MSQFPSLPLFTDAYIADTQHLSNEEHGAYLRLIMFAWRSPDCTLPDDDGRLARMLGLTAGKWRRLKPAVMAFWTLSDGKWTQKRLAKEHAFVAKKVEQNKSNGSKGGRPKSLENNEHGKAAGSQGKTETKAPTPTPTKAASAAPTRESALRSQIASLFRELAPNRIIPDTNRALVWLANGHSPELIVAVVREVLARKPDVGSLSYFDRRIEEASRHHPEPAPVRSIAKLPVDPEQDRRNRAAKAKAHFRDQWRQGWPDEMRPGHPACTTPPDVIEEARLAVDREQAAYADGLPARRDRGGRAAA